MSFCQAIVAFSDQYYVKLKNTVHENHAEKHYACHTGSDGVWNSMKHHMKRIDI